MTEQEIKQYIENLEKAGGQQIGPGPGASAARQAQERQGSRFTSDVAAALSTFPDIRPQEGDSALPELLGIAGGVLPFVAPQLGVSKRIIQAGQAMRAPVLGPSLIGSTAGTVLGTALEPALTGKEYGSSEFAKSLVTNVVENAVWDVGGNLTFQLGGKLFKVAKDTFKPNISSQVDPRQAVQEWLSNRGATLTKSQLTGSAAAETMEDVARGGFGERAFVEQQKKVGQAITSGLVEVKDTLQTSPAFKLALAADEPFTRAAGDNFKELIKIGRTEFSSAFRPYYDNLSSQTEVKVNFRDVKKAAQEEFNLLKKQKFASDSAKQRKEVLDDILAQDEVVDFGVAHGLRSSFGESASSASSPGLGTSAKGAAYAKYEQAIDAAMDNASGSLAKNVLQEYRAVTGKYKQGKNNLFNGTIAAAMEESPSKVGAYLGDLSESEKFTDLFKAISSVDEYVKNQGKQGVQLLNDVKYSFLETNLSTPEKAAAFATKLTENKDLNSSFYKLFRNEATQLKSILQAADVGLEKSAEGRFLRNKALVLGGTGTGAVAGYLLLPDNMQNQISDNFPQLAITAGVFVLTPRMLARASTSKDAMDALAGLAKASKQPKIAGATTAKLIDMLNKSGIIDSEYITSVNQVFNAPTQTPQTPGPIDIERYLQELEAQEAGQRE
jgi:hypothetical protein